MADQEKDETTASNVNTKTILTLSLYCLSGTLLTLVNKLAIIVFPFTNMLLVLQNSVTVILLLIHLCLFASGSVPPLNIGVIKIWTPVVLLFVTMLISSLFALIYVSVPTVIVIRNLSTLSVAALEYLILGTTIDGLSVITLFGMLIGAVFYAVHDLTFSIEGYAWLCVNIMGTSTYQVYIKKIIDLPEVKEYGTIGMSYYNNLLSLPILIILVCIMGEFKVLLSYSQSLFVPKIKSVCIVLFSCVLGFSLSTSAFALNKLISPTSIMVANNVNKFVLIILSEIFIQWTLDLTASIGAIFVLFCGWIYSQTKQSFSKPLFFFATILFFVLYATLEFNHAFIPVINSGIFSQLRFVNQTNTSLPSFSMALSNGTNNMRIDQYKISPKNTTNG